VRLFYLHARQWVRRAPGIPCALCFSRVMFRNTRTQIAPRECSRSSLRGVVGWQSESSAKCFNARNRKRAHHSERDLDGGHGACAFPILRLELMLSNPTLTVDISGTILAWSREAQALLGYTEAEALGRSIELIIPAHLRGRHHAGFSRFVQTGVSTLPEVVTTPMVHKGGETKKLLISVKAVRDGNQKIVAVAATIRPRDGD
jgi:PAS domain S-box-containing protein